MNFQPRKAKWTVGQAATRWVEQHGAHLGSQKAKANEQSYLRQLVKRLGKRKLGSITLDDLKDYQRERRTEVRERPINLELRILGNVLKEAKLWRVVGEGYKPLREPESELGRALSRRQLRLLEEVAATNDNWTVAYNAEVLAANTGLRGGEIKKLRLGAIDLGKRRIHIQRKATKTNAGARLIELNQSALNAISKLYARAQSLGATEPEHYLLPTDLSRHTRKSDPLSGRKGFDVAAPQKSWDTAWRNLRNAAAEAIRARAKNEDRDLDTEERDSISAFRRLRFHDLRHTFITLLGEGGVPLQVIQALVGQVACDGSILHTHQQRGCPERG